MTNTDRTAGYLIFDGARLVSTCRSEGTADRWREWGYFVKVVYYDA